MLLHLLLAKSSLNQSHSLLLVDDWLQGGLEALDCFAVGLGPLSEARTANNRSHMRYVSILGLLAFNNFLPNYGRSVRVAVQAQLTPQLVHADSIVARNHHRRLVDGGWGKTRLLVQTIAALLKCFFLLFVLLELIVNI